MGDEAKIPFVAVRHCSADDRSVKHLHFNLLANQFHRFLIESHRKHPIFSLSMGYHMPRWRQVVTVRLKKIMIGSFFFVKKAGFSKKAVGTRQLFDWF